MGKEIIIRWESPDAAESNTDWILLNFDREPSHISSMECTKFQGLTDHGVKRIKRLASQCGGKVTEDWPSKLELARHVEISRKIEELKGNTAAIKEWMMENVGKGDMFDYFWQRIWLLQK